MAHFAAEMLAIAVELAAHDPVYEDMARKFFEHYLAIVTAINTLDGTGLWDEADGFYYDHLHFDGRMVPLKCRSIVGLVPLFAVETFDRASLERLPAFRRRIEWFARNRPEQTAHLDLPASGTRERYLLSAVSRPRLERILRRVLDEQEFLSPYGIRSLSRVHAERPFVFQGGGVEHRVAYVPGEADGGLFGGNSNWRGPIWMPVNLLLVRALLQLYSYYGDDFTMEYPTGSGEQKTLFEISQCIGERIVSIFTKDEQGRRPVYGAAEKFQTDPHWKDLILFYEYFHGDDGSGIGASHQTGWTGCVARIIQALGYFTPEGVLDTTSPAMVIK
jgi:hypothetical protein